jgi:hypothetical protein
MKAIAVLLALCGLASGCGGSPSQTGGGSSGQPGGGSPDDISMRGTWTVTTSADGASNTSQVALVPSPCSLVLKWDYPGVDNIDTTFNFSGKSCFIANNLSGMGSVSGQTGLYYPLQVVLITAPSGSFPDSSSVQANVLFVEADGLGHSAQYGGACTLITAGLPATVQCGGSGALNDGVLANGGLTGTWMCGTGSFCTGVGKNIASEGTFSGTKQ